MNNFPSGTVTFLFTDIEGSTKLAQAHPGKWETVRERHDSILREVIESNNGYVFQIVGDAFCAAFHTVKDGVGAAVDIQRKLRCEDWGGTPIRVRMGLHTGEAELREKTDHCNCDQPGIHRWVLTGHGGEIDRKDQRADKYEG